MTAIKIIKGVFGYRNPKGYLEPKTVADPPFEVSDSAAKRLVAQGVAERYPDVGIAPLKGTPSADDAAAPSKRGPSGGEGGGRKPRTEKPPVISAEDPDDGL
jgi:hypothetical protein